MKRSKRFLNRCWDNFIENCPCGVAPQGQIVSFWRNGAYYLRGENAVKEDEKKPLSWEVADPKPPVIQSGHMESRKEN